ncbi:hypothetical protein [Streptomyces sp. NPDC058394]|uniref:hypothetical protein n=1 Tax=Streptomyces sp. NPDC058394 TaxID=3346477 RepID=UPI00366685F7
MGDVAQIAYPGVAENGIVQPTVVAVGTEHGSVPGHVDFEQVALVFLDLRLGGFHVIGVPMACLCRLGAGGDQVRHQGFVLPRLCRRAGKTDRVLEVRLEGICRLPGVRFTGSRCTGLGVFQEALQEGARVLPGPGNVADLLR